MPPASVLRYYRYFIFLSLLLLFPLAVNGGLDENTFLPFNSKSSIKELLGLDSPGKGYSIWNYGFGRFASKTLVQTIFLSPWQLLAPTNNQSYIPSYSIITATLFLSSNPYIPIAL
jgi:hypothetical protein